MDHSLIHHVLLADKTVSTRRWVFGLKRTTWDFGFQNIPHPALRGSREEWLVQKIWSKIASVRAKV